MSPPVRPLTRDARLAIQRAAATHDGFLYLEQRLRTMHERRRHQVAEAVKAGATYQAIADGLRIKRQTAWKITHPTNGAKP